MRLIDWILGLFSKPKEEVTFEKAELAIEPWPFPVPKKKRGRPALKKASTRKPATKKTVKKTVVKLAKKAK
jgi:hypothetical protein